MSEAWALLPRELVVAMRAEIRALTGHWAQGFTSGGMDLTRHDNRMPDGTCLPCSLLAELDAVLYADADAQAPAAPVVNLGARRRVPPGGVR